MGLAAPYTGEVELDVVMDLFEGSDADITDEQAVILGLLAGAIEGIFRAQTSAVARNRSIVQELRDAAGNRRAPVLAALVMDIASKAHILRNEILAINNAPTIAQLIACDADQDFTLLGPVH